MTPVSKQNATTCPGLYGGVHEMGRIWPINEAFRIARVIIMAFDDSPFMLPGLKQGTLPMALPPTRALQQISMQDIASFTALVFENRDRFLGKRVNIGGDEIDGVRTAEIISRASGRSGKVIQWAISCSGKRRSLRI